VTQDGFLRPYDVSTVLWPAGYLLARWLASPPICTALQGASVLELGAGVGLPSIAAALCGATVRATDASANSLVLATLNAAANGAWMEASKLNYTDRGQVNRERREHTLRGRGYDWVVGASLQFETWADELWPVLRTLTRCCQQFGERGQAERERCAARRNGGEAGGCNRAPPAMVALVHTKGALHPPSVLELEGFTLVDRLDSGRYGMHGARRHLGREVSEFEIIVLKRTCAVCEEG